jgi:hypothetical protein
VEEGSIPRLWDREWEESAASGKSAAELEGALSGAGDGRWRRKASLDCGMRSEGVRSTYEGIHLGRDSRNAFHLTPQRWGDAASSTVHFNCSNNPNHVIYQAMS